MADDPPPPPELICRCGLALVKILVSQPPIEGEHDAWVCPATQPVGPTGA